MDFWFPGIGIDLNKEAGEQADVDGQNMHVDDPEAGTSIWSFTWWWTSGSSTFSFNFNFFLIILIFYCPAIKGLLGVGEGFCDTKRKEMKKLETNLSE